MSRQNKEAQQTQSTTQGLEARSNRRDFLRLSSGAAAAGVVLGLPFPSAAQTRPAVRNVANITSQQPLPIVDARFPSRIADGIWIIPDKRVPLVANIGIVEGDKTVLVIDSGFTAQCGRNVLEAARRIAGKRDILLTVTHAHPEHTFGAQAFEGQAKIFYNKLQRDYLARAGETLLKGFRAFLAPDRVSILDDIRITLANDIYEGSYTSIDLGNRQVEFRTWGIAHSPGDQIITIPDQKVMFAGDLIEERIFPIVPLFPPMIRATDINLRMWEAALTQIAQSQPKIIVPGHGNLGGVEIADQVLDYFREIRKLTAAFKNNKAILADVIRQLEPVVQRNHPTWERKEFIAPALRYLTLSRLES